MTPIAGAMLLVEDTPSDVLLFQQALQRTTLKAELRIVGDGAAAMKYLAGEPPFESRFHNPLPEVILLDLKLPRWSGLDVLEWRARQPLLRCIPVVVLSGSAAPTDIQRAYELGANSYLVKPIGFPALVEMVQVIHKYWIRLNVPPAPMLVEACGRGNNGI